MSERYLTIVEIETGEVVKRVDVTGHSKRSIDKIERGMFLNLDRERFLVGYKEAEEIQA